MANTGRPNPGSVQINGIWLMSPATPNSLFECTLMFHSCVIFEDIFSPFITGEITFIDTDDMVGRTPIVGQETLYFSFSTPYDDRVYTDTDAQQKMMFSGEYIISSIKNRRKVSDKATELTLGFVSKEAYYDITHPFCKGYQGSPSDIAYGVLTDTNFGLNTTKRLIVENASNTIQYVSNYWTPVQNLNYLIENSVNENGSPSYVFFENKNGFNYISLDTLISKELVTKANVPSFKVDKSTQVFEKAGGTVTNYEVSYSRVDGIRYVNNSSFFERALRGLLGSTVISPDVNNKDAGVVTKSLDYQQYFQKQKNHLNQYPVVNASWEQNPLTKLMVIPIQSNSKIASGATTASPRSVDDLSKKETESLDQLNKNLKENQTKLADLKTKLAQTKDAKAKADLQKDIDATQKTIDDLNKSITQAKANVDKYEKDKANGPSDSGWSQAANTNGADVKTKTTKDDKGVTTVYSTTYDKDGNVVAGVKTTTGSDGKVQVYAFEVKGDSIEVTKSDDTATGSKIDKYSDATAKTENKEYTAIIDEFKNGEVVKTDISDAPTDGVNNNVEYILQRRAIIASFGDTAIEIDVLGRFNYFVGMIVSLTVPKTVINSNDWMDKLNSGNYIVTAIKHSIMHDKHICTLELSRDSLNQSI